MIIMPGETKTISIPLKRQTDGSFRGEWRASGALQITKPQNIVGSAVRFNYFPFVFGAMMLIAGALVILTPFVK